MSIGSFRNKPCYRGSNKKLKKCHLPIVEDYNRTKNPKLIKELPGVLQARILSEIEKSKFLKKST